MAEGFFVLPFCCLERCSLGKLDLCLIPAKMPLAAGVSGVVPMVCVVLLALVVHQRGWVMKELVDSEVPVTQQENMLGNLLGPGATESRGFCIAVA